MRITQALAVLVLANCLAGHFAGASTQESYATEHEGFHITWDTQNVPHYTFSYSSDNSSAPKYQLQLVHLFEATKDAKGNWKRQADTELELSSLRWEFTPVHTKKGVATFDVYATSLGRFDKLTFSNYFGSGKNASNIKFDIKLDNYVWKSSADKLAIVFLLTSNDNPDGSNSATSTNEGVQLERAYLRSTKKAVETQSGNLIDVEVANQQEGSDPVGTWIVYRRFQGQMVHDPEFGVNPPSNVVGVVIGVIIGVLVALGIIAAVIAYIRHRRNKAYGIH